MIGISSIFTWEFKNVTTSPQATPMLGRGVKVCRQDRSYTKKRTGPGCGKRR